MGVTVWGWDKYGGGYYDGREVLTYNGVCVMAVMSVNIGWGV